MNKIIFLLAGLLAGNVAHAGAATEAFCADHPDNEVCREDDPEPSPGWRQLVAQRTGHTAEREPEARISTRRSDPQPEPAPPAIVTQAYDTPWFDGHTDPLYAMVDPARGEPMACVQNPAFTSGQHIQVRNRSAYPLRVRLSGNDVTVFSVDDRVQTAIVYDQGNQMRYSILYPGQTCWLQVPRNAYGASVKYRVGFSVTTETGPHGHPMGLEYSTLHSTALTSCGVAKSYPVPMGATLAFGPSEGAKCGMR